MEDWIQYNSQQNNSRGIHATYFCVEGYYLVGISTQVCQADGSWTGSDPDLARMVPYMHTYMKAGMYSVF